MYILGIICWALFGFFSALISVSLMNKAFSDAFFRIFYSRTINKFANKGYIITDNMKSKARLKADHLSAFACAFLSLLLSFFIIFLLSALIG